MNLRNLFRVYAAIVILSGLGFLFVPQAATVADLSSFGLYTAQQLGAINLAFGILLLLVSGMAPSPARQAAVTAAIVHQLVTGIVHLVAVLGGVIPGGAGWFGVGFSLVFVLAFGYFGFIRQEGIVKPEFQS
ncbi:MAG: hypothetical protein P8074_25495 [Anaerolineales bacterium]|jgi:hypothetical protein